MTPKRKEQLRRKLQEARFRLRKKLPRFAQPLEEMRYCALKPLNHMSTNGESIFFDPDWLWKLDPEALDFMLAHQLMHIYLGHIHRSAFYQGARYHLACDIIANSYLRRLGWREERLTGVGTLYHQTFYPVLEGCELTPEEAFTKVPMDPATLSPAARRRYMIDDEACWNVRGDSGELILSPDDEDPKDLRAVLRPVRKPFGPTYSAMSGFIPAGRGTEEPVPNAGEETPAEANKRSEEIDSDEPDAALIDVIESIIRAREAEQARMSTAHPEEFKAARTAQAWESETKESLKSIRADLAHSLQRAEESRGDERFWQRVNRTCLDWRQLLDAFLQEEVCDYSFLPPDHRYQEGDFFLPDFNDRQIQPLKVLFMVDTSGSISDELLSIAYTEIQSAIEQFNGNLTGLLGFFDLQVYPPVPFSSVSDLRRARVYGGGGTDFGCVFRDCRQYFGDEQLSSVVILTDGQGEFPSEEESFGIPTLWLLTEENVLPPWGRCAYLNRE